MKEKKEHIFKGEEEENTITKIQEFVQVNSKKISVISISVVVVVVAIFVIKSAIERSGEEARNAASVAISRLTTNIQQGDYDIALNGDSTRKVRDEEVIGLVQIVEKYGGTDEGKTAAMYAGNCFLALKKYEDAKKYFEIASKADSKVVIEGAYAGLGASAEATGNIDDAIKYYEKATELTITDANKSRYRFYTALLYEKKGQVEKAESLYRDIIYEGKSEFTGPAKGNLVRLGMIIE